MTAAFSFVPLALADLPLLHAWMQRPHVAERWGPVASIEELRADFVDPADAPRATRAFIAWHAGRPVGFIQCYHVMNAGGDWWPLETDPTARGIDQFLAHQGDLGRGLGRAMIQSFVARVFATTDASSVQADPSPGNERAIRCYRAAGFVPVGEVTTPDGLALLLRCTRPEAV